MGERAWEVWEGVTASLFPHGPMRRALCFHHVDWSGLGLEAGLGPPPNPHTLMSSGRLLSARFSRSFLWMDSRVASTLGFTALSTSSCFFSSSFSSWEPKLLGSVLLRCRILGARSSSDIFSLDSGVKTFGEVTHENWCLLNPSCFSVVLITV